MLFVRLANGKHSIQRASCPKQTNSPRSNYSALMDQKSVFTIVSMASSRSDLSLTAATDPQSLQQMLHQLFPNPHSPLKSSE